jgi:hypothetical protein
MRHFGSYDKALKAARIDPIQVRLRKRWDRASVIRALKSARRAGAYLSDSSVRRNQPALYGAATRIFGSFKSARAASGVKWKPKRG